MDSDRLEAFVAVAEQGGFTRAAAALGKTQPAISHHVARLEEELGQRLFTRNGRHTRLTQAGRVLLEHAQESFRVLASARRQLDSLAGLHSGELSLGTSDTHAYYVLPPVLAAFRAQHPGVELRIANQPSPLTAQAVMQHSLDLGLVAEPLPAPLLSQLQAARLQLEPLMQQQDVAIVAPDHPLARQGRVQLKALVAHPLVLLDHSTGSRAYLEQRLAEAGLSAQVAMEMNSLALVKRLVELGFGASLVPSFCVEREVQEGRLTALQVTGLPPRSLSLLTPRGGPTSVAGLAFVALCQQLLGQDRCAAPTI